MPFNAQFDPDSWFANTLEARFSVEPLALSIPPPVDALFFEKVSFIDVAVPLTFSIPPPCAETLYAIVSSMAESVAKLLTPPPLPGLPSAASKTLEVLPAPPV